MVGIEMLANPPRYVEQWHRGADKYRMWLDSVAAESAQILRARLQRLWFGAGAQYMPIVVRDWHELTVISALTDVLAANHNHIHDSRQGSSAPPKAGFNSDVEIQLYFHLGLATCSNSGRGYCFWLSLGDITGVAPPVLAGQAAWWAKQAQHPACASMPECFGRAPATEKHADAAVQSRPRSYPSGLFISMSQHRKSLSCIHARSPMCYH